MRLALTSLAALRRCDTPSRRLCPLFVPSFVKAPKTRAEVISHHQKAVAGLSRLSKVCPFRLTPRWIPCLERVSQRPIRAFRDAYFVAGLSRLSSLSGVRAPGFRILHSRHVLPPSWDCNADDMSRAANWLSVFPDCQRVGGLLVILKPRFDASRFVAASINCHSVTASPYVSLSKAQTEAQTKFKSQIMCNTICDYRTTPVLRFREKNRARRP